MRAVKADSSVLVLALILILLAGGILAAIFFFRSDPIEQSLAGDRVINTLFVIENEDKPLSSYVLMYYPATQRAAVFDNTVANLRSRDVDLSYGTKRLLAAIQKRNSP